MEKRGSQHKIYGRFLEFVANDIQGERFRLHRRMLNVFVWCFLLPASISATVLLLVKFQVIQSSARAHLDWLVLVFPVLYSLYVLGSEVLLNIPAAFRRGGMATNLAQAEKEGEWRDRVSEAMTKTLKADKKEWEWILLNFEMDLKALKSRTKHLTALGGAVFFLLMQGIDSLADSGASKSGDLLDAATTNFSQYVGLALFLTLLYLSGTQTYHMLNRYLNCAQLAKRKVSD